MKKIDFKPPQETATSRKPTAPTETHEQRPLNLDTISYLTDEELRALPFNDILCPVLRIGIRAKLLTLDQDGTVPRQELDRYMDQIGLRPESTILKAVIDAAQGIKINPDKPDTVCLTALKGAKTFDHGSVSGILRYEVSRTDTSDLYSREALEQLKQHSRDGENLDLDDLALATNKFHECPFKKVKTSVFGVFAATFEYALLLDIFGNIAENKKKYFSLKDVDSIWALNRFPRYWSPPRKPYFGSLRFIRLTTAHAWKKLDIKVKSYLRALFSEKDRQQDFIGK